MFSLQKFFGKDDRFFDLLEASAEESRLSVQALIRALAAPQQAPGMTEFHRAKEADKKITEQINEALMTSFVSQLEREDIEILSASLYKIPKTVVCKTDFSRHTALLDAATIRVVEIVKLLRGIGSGQLDKAKEINGRLQQIESEADKLILEILKDLYSGKHNATQVLALKDLFELLEKVVDRCRDTGNIVVHIILKNS
jgi:uncharacterized protein